jgi:hypothetical protein
LFSKKHRKFLPKKIGNFFSGKNQELFFSEKTPKFTTTFLTLGNETIGNGLKTVVKGGERQRFSSVA